MMGIELLKNMVKQNQQPMTKILDTNISLVELMQKNGLISRAMGDSIALAPPLIINEKQIQEIVLIVKRSIAQLHELLGQNDKLGH